MSQIEAKLKQLPTDPGVYFFRDDRGQIIYIGKAAVLKNRVSSYFQKSQHHDIKTRILVSEIKSVDWIALGSEVEALFLESEFIKRYRPIYNIDWKDEKNFIYIKITTVEDFPVVSYVRRPMDDRSTYFGPFTSSDALKRAMKLLRKVFPYVTHARWPERGCLQYHLGLCPGPEEAAISSADYKRRFIRNLILYLRGERDKLTQNLQREMDRAARKRDFEGAAKARDQLRALQTLGKQMVFGDREAFDLTQDQALVGLADRLHLRGIPRRIEAYDISHLQGSDNVASMIVFSDGVPNRDEYRRFKMRLRGNDDFAHMREVIRRRFSGKNLEQWPAPDLILIDGGKGQLASALAVMAELGIEIPAIGLAKREEEIIRRRDQRPIDPGHYEDEAWIKATIDFETILLPKTSTVLQLLQRVRDEAHRFAVTYHSLLRGKRQTHSPLDDVPGIGPATKKKLLIKLGSLGAVQAAELSTLSGLIGVAKARSIKENLR